MRTKHLNKVFVMARVRKMIQKFFSLPSLKTLQLNKEFIMSHHNNIGVAIEERAAKKVALSKDGQSVLVHRPHQHTLPKDEVATIRNFLVDCGINPEKAA